MKLEAILGNLNSLEKNAFLKIIDGILANSPKNAKEIEKILTDKNKDLKNADDVIIVRIFNLVQEEFEEYVRVEFVNTSSQLDILTDIIIRDGNCIMKHDWLARLYEIELKHIEKKAKELNKSLVNGRSDTSRNTTSIGSFRPI
ncbi:MAG: hypothetical protein WD037_10270 [Balneolales bacterium]